MKNYTAALIALILLVISVITGGCDMLAQDKDEGEDVLYVYSWGDYLDPDVLVQFEEETGIHVVLDEYDTNESMYPRVAEGGREL